MGVYCESPNILQVLTPEKQEKLHEAALHLLRKVGVVVGYPVARERLAGMGARVDGDRVYFEEEVLRRALDLAPASFRLYDRNGNEAMVLDRKTMYFGTGTDSVKFLDPRTGEIGKCTCESARMMSVLTDALPNIDFIDAVGMIEDVDPRIGSRMAFAIALENTTKVLNFCADYAESYEDIIELAAGIAGGVARLKEKPFLFGYCEPVTPLNHSEDTCKKLEICATAGVPVVYMPYCMRGGTAPVTLGGALAQSLAEILSGLAIHQAFAPGAPFIMGCMPSIMDMKTMIGSYGAPEFHYGVHASAEMAVYYDLPFYGTGGTTDSAVFDFQAGAEAMMNLLGSFLGQANFVHDLGTFLHNVILSPEFLVLCNDLVDTIKIYRTGDFLDEASLALDVIEKVGPKGNYLMESHTLKNFRKIRYSRYFERKTSETEHGEMASKLRADTLKLLDKHEPQPLTESQMEVLEDAKRKWCSRL